MYASRPNPKGSQLKVFITGGTGFVGRAVIDALLADGHSISALVNHEPVPLSGTGVESFPGGLFDDSAMRHALSGCDAAIHLVGIIAENPAKGVTFQRIHVQGTMRVVDAVKKAGIKKYLHMSALGAASDTPSMYQRTKFQAEQYVRSSDLNWTILRPSLIHGAGGDFTKTQADWARGKTIPFFFMPYFANGLLGNQKTKIQPVFVEDVARAFVQSLQDAKPEKQIMEIAGPEQMTWADMHRKAAEIITGKSRLTLPIPAWYAKAITRIIPSALVPFTHDQVLMAQQDNICNLEKFVNLFGWTPRPFEQTLQSYKDNL